MSGTVRPGHVLIVGAGAVGCALAGVLLQSGLRVTMLVRGPALAALRTNGLRFQAETGEYILHPEVEESLPEAQADILLLALKSHQLPALAPMLAARQELVVPVVNGVPFWFTPAGDLPEDAGLGGVLSEAIPKTRLAGCAAYMMSRLVAPGHVICERTPKLRIGAVSQGGGAAVAEAVSLLRKGGLQVEMADNPAEAVWHKLLANAATNPLSVLTGASLRQIAETPALLLCAQAVAGEMTMLGRAAGLALHGEPAGCLQAIEMAGGHVTSMRQDYEAGRALEYEAICGAPLVLAAKLGVEMPASQAIFALTRYAAASRPDIGV